MTDDKNFSIWHRIKTLLSNQGSRPYFREREVWMCNVGLNIGHEQDGRGPHYLRPIVVIRKFNPQIFLAVPLTRTIREGRYYHQFSFKDDTVSVAILSQIKLCDSKRLKYKLGIIEQHDFTKLKEKLKLLLE